MTGTAEPMLADQEIPVKPRGPTSKKGQLMATISVSLIAWSAGTTLSWSSPCLAELEDANSTTAIHISQEEASWVGSLIAIGALLSAIPAGYCADKFGRKNSLLAITIPFTISWAFIIKASAVWMLYLGRLLAGVGTGAACVLTPMYIAEITEDSVRGPLCSFFALFLCSGIVFTFVIATFAKFVLLSSILAIVPMVFCVSFFFMPESPFYLLKTNRDKEAGKSLKFFRGKHADIVGELADMKRDIETSPEEKASLKEILCNRHYRRCLIACIVLFLFQQLSGINAVIFYTVPIFKASKSEMDPIVASILVSFIQVFVTVLVIFIIDKQGRRSYMLQSSVVNCISLAFLAMYFHLRSLHISFIGLDLVPLTSLMIFIFSFSIGMGPLPWVILGELLSPEIIGTVSGIAVMMNWFTGFVVTKSFGPMMLTLGAFVTFYIFAAFNALCLLCVYLFVPETRGRSQYEIQTQWKG
ncbi:nebulosa [Carabus blaptoides fortunei]